MFSRDIRATRSLCFIYLLVDVDDDDISIQLLDLLYAMTFDISPGFATLLLFDRLFAAVDVGISVSGTKCGVLLDIGGNIGLAGHGYAGVVADGTLL